MRRCARPSATAFMNGCAMPAPAPCARTKQASGSAGATASAETSMPGATEIAICIVFIRLAGFRVSSGPVGAGARPRRASWPCRSHARRPRTPCSSCPSRGVGDGHPVARVLRGRGDLKVTPETPLRLFLRTISDFDRLGGSFADERAGALRIVSSAGCTLASPDICASCRPRSWIAIDRAALPWSLARNRARRIWSCAM
jgi:hypothetical protein